MQVVVPFAATEPKTRLTPVLTAPERDAFARAMLSDVLTAITDSGHEPTVLTTAPLEGINQPVVVDDRPLSAAVNNHLPEEPGQAVAVVMADLALATPDSLDQLFTASGDVVIAPGRGGGTNALIVREPAFSVDYHGVSYCDHCKRAAQVDAAVTTVDSYRLGTDVDEPADLVDVLIHSDGRAASWLRERGFSLVPGDGRVTVERASN